PNATPPCGRLRRRVSGCRDQGPGTRDQGPGTRDQGSLRPGIRTVIPSAARDLLHEVIGKSRSLAALGMTGTGHTFRAPLARLAAEAAPTGAHAPTASAPLPRRWWDGSRPCRAGRRG